MSVLTVSDATGLLKKAQYLLPEILFILCSIVIFTDANLADNLLKETSISPSQAPLVAPATPDLPLPANLPLFRRSRRKHLLPHGAPAHPPFIGPLITSRQPPTSSSLSKPLMKRSALEPPSAGLANISPAQFSTGTIPSGLAEPPLSPDSSDCCKPDTVLKRASHGCHCVYPIKLDLVLLNVSQNPNWNLFLEELASQLGLRVSQIELINFYVLSLSQLNISMDITPHTGISFSASDASAINFSLTTHKVHFDSTLVGDYKLLNFTWFEPPAPSQAPLASSPPMKAPTHRASPSLPSSTSNKGKHSNLILIFGIGTGLLITAIISVLIFCSCAFRGRKSKASPKETAKPRLLLLLFVLSTVSIGWVNSHEESGKWSCESDSEIRVLAEFKPGLITLDGHADDWEDIDGSEFSLLPALDPHAEHEYKGGKMNVKALHDGHDVYFLLQVDGEYVYSKGENTRCPSIALMFQIGEDATYHNMGGCKEGTGSCTSKTCKGHEVDIMHFSIGSAIPGRLYGGNPVDNSEGNGGDRFGHLVDVYAWTPHCRYLDGMGPSGNDSSAQNDWKGAWWHSSFSVHSGFVEEDSPYASGGQKGTYYFEFSRPLRTMDHIQQDVQFKIGESSKLSVAFWYPVDRNPWHGSGHYTINCDWVPLDISSGSSLLTKSAPGSSGGSTASVFALLLSVVSLCVSVFVGYRVIKPNSVPFTPMENL